MIDQLFHNYPVLAQCEADILAAFELIRSSYQTGGKLLVCGNGGSAADAEHMVGELMKAFNLRRPLPEDIKRNFTESYGEDGEYLANRLQSALTAISLVSQSSLTTAIINDESADLVFAQQVIGYGAAGDVLIAISTSGNSKNVLNAVYTARVKGLKVVGLTGEKGGKLKDHCDVSIRVPAGETPRIQELHVPVYHTLCAMLEDYFFGIR
ncbi:MAG: SIS domain-containing protein [Bacteroidales bacterium]|nr:SIS domain-containing protein [Bacteroidales bacterium]